jgi:phosphatidylserine decarboxylase
MDSIYGLFEWIWMWIKQLYNREVGHLTMDRKSKRLQRERRPLLKQLRVLLLFNRFTEWIDVTKTWRMHLHHESIKEGEEMKKTSSKKRIAPFVKFYGIDVNDFEPSDINQFEVITYFTSFF